MNLKQVMKNLVTATPEGVLDSIKNEDLEISDPCEKCFTAMILSDECSEHGSEWMGGARGYVYEAIYKQKITKEYIQSFIAETTFTTTLAMAMISNLYTINGALIAEGIPDVDVPNHA